MEFALDYRKAWECVGLKIKQLVDVKPQPTVVRLDHLQESDSAWITENYYITAEVENHLTALKHLFGRPSGSGVFLIGHYGSGKSHFLAYIVQTVARRLPSGRSLHPVPISLLNFNSEQPLEAILLSVLSAQGSSLDRRDQWSSICARYSDGLLLILDELSEFLRSKPSRRQFNEDIRFLQFLGEFSQNHRLWVVAALQEQIEHTGEMEFDLFRKIKDRYPIRLILSPTHIKDLIAEKILRKKPGYEEAVETLADQLKTAFPASNVEFADFCAVYPLHPTTLALLEEVRDCFSQARGVIGFTIEQLAGDPARGTEPFVEREWGDLLSPDAIVDHFRDLFEVQPEFLALAQKILPYYRKHLQGLFKSDTQRALADRVLKLLILVHLSPSRSYLNPNEAAWWLLYKVSSIEPERNISVITRILETFADKGAYVARTEDGFAIDLKEDRRQALEQWVQQAVAELKDDDATLFERLIPCLHRSGFDPFTLDRDRWQKHKLRWHFHERELLVYFGGGSAHLKEGLGLHIGLPWGPVAAIKGCYRLIPKTMSLSGELKELVGLMQLSQSPRAAAFHKEIEDRIQSRRSLFIAQFRNAYRSCELVDPSGTVQKITRDPPENAIRDWLWQFGDFIFRQVYPRFEAFAPVHGPLPKSTYRQLAVFALEGDLADEDPPEFVTVIREAYLVPMKLMEHKGRFYRVSPKLDQNELVSLLRPLLDHQPSPKRIYAHLSMPVYGLVADQIHLLLLFLKLQGEIEIYKGKQTYNELFESFPLPIHYDRIVLGKALNINQLRDFQIICQGLKLNLPNDPNVLAQRRCAAQLAKFGQKQQDLLSEFSLRLSRTPGTEALAQKIESHLAQWRALEKGENAIQGLQHFLFQVGSPRGFLERHFELQELPAKLDSLLAETRRFQHLLHATPLKESRDASLDLQLTHLGSPPSITETDALEEWLGAARVVYSRFQSWYRNVHDEYWHELSRNALWNYKPPAVAASRHLGLKDVRDQFFQLQERARANRCTGLSDLEFQAMCRCGFDGQRASISELMEPLKDCVDRLESSVAGFFQQEKVREKVSDWLDSGVESNEQTLAYVVGNQPYPHIENLALFDQHLAGIELFSETDPTPIIDVLFERVWERQLLQQKLQAQVARLAPRISFKKPGNTERDPLLRWCLQTALETGTPLPAFLNGSEVESMAPAIRAQWLSPQSIANLDSLGLGKTLEDHILQMVLDGQVKVPPNLTRGLAAVARAVAVEPEIKSVETWVQWTTQFYRAHKRMTALAGTPWLDRLDSWSEKNLDGVAGVQDLLQQEQERQWLLLDCLGVPLWEMFREQLSTFFPRWEWEDVRFGQVSPVTDTASFYEDLARDNPQKAFEKLDVVDQLVHSFKGDFPDLEKRVRLELEIACGKLKGLDPARDLLIFADHGFRINQQGDGFAHGGASTVERLVPVIRMKALV